MKVWSLCTLLVIYFVLCLGCLLTPGLIQSIEKTDIDKPFYTGQMQSLILGKETIFMHPSYRILSPAISIGISSMLGTSYTGSMIILSYFSGIFTILFLWFFFYKITLSNNPTEEEAHNKRLLITGLYISSASIIMFATTYYIDTLATLFAFMLIYFTHKTLKDDLRYAVPLAVTLLYSVANKETSLSYIIILVAYAIYLNKHKWIFYFSLVPGIIWYYVQYTVLYGSVKHLIIPSRFTEYMATYNGSFLGTVLVHFVTLKDNLILFFSHRIPLLIFSIIFTFGVSLLFLIPTYIKLWKETPKLRLVISHLLIAGISFLWFVETMAPKFVYYLWAPLLYIIITNHTYPYYKSKVWLLIIINLILCVLFLVVYVLTHQAASWESFFEIGT